MKVILSFLLLCFSAGLSLNSWAANHIAVHIAKKHYHHPVRLLHPYADYWHLKGPLAEKASLSTLQQRYQNTQLCQDTDKADILLLIEPQMFYNPQSHLFYAKLTVQAYNQAGGLSTQDPAFTISKQVMQPGSLMLQPEYYMEKAYQQAMQSVLSELEKQPAFTDSQTKKPIQNICRAIDQQPTNIFYY